MTDSSREILESMDKEHLIELVDKLVEANKKMLVRLARIEQQLNDMEDLEKLIESIEERKNEIK